MKLLCFPFAGGGSQAFRGWGKELGVEVVVAQLPGREGRFRDPALTSMAALVDDLLDRHGSAMSGTFAFFGHSMGSQIAFAVARELARHGRPGPRCLIASGSGAPHLPSRRPNLHSMPQGEMVQKLREYGGTPEEVLSDPEMLEFFMPLLRADLTLAETYSVADTDTVTCPIYAVGGTDDSSVDRDEVEGWAALTTGGCQVQFLVGGHFFLLDQRADLLAFVRTALAAVRET